MAQAQASLARLTAEKDQLEREFSNTNDALKVQLSATQVESKEKMREALEAKGKVDVQVENLERQLAAKTAELEKYRDKEAEDKLADPTKEAIALMNSLRTSIQGRKETMTQIRTAGSKVQEAMDHLRSTVSSSNRASGRQ
jgi:chromosome segregation ATPase